MKKRAPAITLFILTILICTGSMTLEATAQIKGIREGDRVRIITSSPGDTVTGKVLQLTATHIQILSESPAPFQADVELNSIQRLEVAREVPRTGRGALMGAGIGGLTFAFLNVVTFKDACLGGFGCNTQSSGELLLEGARAGIVFGGIIGALIGTVTLKEKWKQVPLDISPAGTVVHGDGIERLRYAPGLRFSWSF